MKPHFNSEQIAKRIADSMIRYKSKWAAAGMALVLGAGSIGVSFLYHPVVTAAVPEQESEAEETTAAATTAAPTMAETESAWVPTLDELNLAHYYPDGEDQSDITKSLAGHVFHELMTRDANWSSSLYSYSDVTPVDMAAKLGISRERILGKYNPEDNSHQKENPSTWTIGSFRNVKIQAVDGDGHAVSPYSNVPQIMSMANVYTYYHNPQDSDAFLSYAKALWEASHSYTMSISDVYYCSGCIGKNAEELEQKALLEEAEAEKENPNLERPYEEISEDGSEGGSDTENQTQASVITAGLTKAEKKAKEESLAESIAAETETETVPESTSGVITAPSKQKAASPSNAEKAVAVQDVSDAGHTVSESGALASEASESEPESSVEAEPESEKRSEAEISAADKQRSSGLSCPGHVDLTITMKIGGLTEVASLFSLDAAGNDEENRAAAISLASEDWYQKYGLSVSSISTGTPLTAEEIEAYLEELPSDISETRRELLRFALNSVGKVPYYWGGKPSAKNYEGNHFGTLMSPDVDGRTLKGLDCSGWISWVYWSVTGTHLPYEGTSGLAALGKRISREDLQPGDILIRTGADAHVVMFLGWTNDGRIRCVHETSGSINNVTVGTRNAGWPYYRRLID